MLCPKCNTKLDENASACYICGNEDLGTEAGWTVLGYIDDAVSAALARETLKSCDIPAVVIPRSGFFSSAGLSFSPFFSGRKFEFEVSVPQAFRSDAADLLEATLGDKWQHSEE